MIVYFDTSALVKRYIKESNSFEVNALVESSSSILGSVLITQVEMAAAFRRAVSMGTISDALLSEIWQDFLDVWKSFTYVQITDALAAKASQIAFDHKLRGYDSIHLAAALMWQEQLGMTVTLATFDRELWQAAHEAGLEVWPEKISD